MILKEVSSNKKKTFLYVTLFFIFIILFIYFLTSIFLDSYVALLIATILSILTTWSSYYNADKIVLKLNNARPATREEFLQLNNTLEGLCLATGLPLPKLYVMEDTALNAFATGRNPKNAVICVTTGLINKLDKYEMEGVLAHELSHIRNYDILLSTVVIVLVGLVVIVADMVSRAGFRSHKKDDNDSSIIQVIGLIFILLSPIFANLLKLLISRNREYLADASAVEITRNKEGLISALQKISQDTEPLEQANQSTASLFIVNPLKSERKRDDIFSTHPTTENRIARLRQIN